MPRLQFPLPNHQHTTNKYLFCYLLVFFCGTGMCDNEIIRPPLIVHQNICSMPYEKKPPGLHTNN